MIKQILFGALFVFVTIDFFGQTPFTTLVQEPRFIEEVVNIDNKIKYEAVTDAAKIKLKIDAGHGAKAIDTAIVESSKNNIEFFKNNGLTLNLINKGENRLSVNSQVLHYKLYVANPNEKNKYRRNRYNLPLLVLTKLSSNYDTLSVSNSLDVLDYEAAPITLRLMPSLKRSFVTYNDVIYYGVYVDARFLNLQNPGSNNYSQEIIGSGGIGITYQGDGQAGTYNVNGEYESGRYSLSFILQAAVGDERVISRLFDTDEKYVYSLQSYFLFKVSDESPLNIKAGYQYFFQPTKVGTKHNLSLTLGI